MEDVFGDDPGRKSPEARLEGILNQGREDAPVVSHERVVTPFLGNLPHVFHGLSVCPVLKKLEKRLLFQGAAPGRRLGILRASLEKDADAAAAPAIIIILFKVRGIGIIGANHGPVEWAFPIFIFPVYIYVDLFDQRRHAVRRPKLSRMCQGRFCCCGMKIGTRRDQCFHAR